MNSNQSYLVMSDHLVSNSRLIMIFSLMHVLDTTEPRKPILQNKVISTKQPSHKAMIILSVKYHLKLQLVINTWVLIHPVKNFILSTPINLAHLCLQDINFNPEYREQIQMQNLIHSPRNQQDKNGLDQHICRVIYIIF